MSRCPLCHAASGAPFVHRRGVPLLQNAPAPTAEIARSVLRGELQITACPACAFVYNAAFDPALVAYADDYDNTQACSPRFADYLRGLATELVERHQLHGKRIVEVGCGKGQFLRLLCEIGGNRGFGFDPTYIGPETVDGGTVTFVRELYDERHAVPETHFVCCRHVLEHVTDPLAMLISIRRAICGDLSVPVFVEVPTVDWILRNRCFWDFFYEHHSYFSPQTLTYAFESSGFEVASVTPAFGGQYLWLEARAGTVAAAPHDVAPALAAIEDFAASFDSEFAALARDVQDHASDGVAIWGAGAKGVTLANLLDPTGQLIRYVVDINPRKQGGFIPGTGHAIVPPAELGAHPLRLVLGMNAMYREEIEAEAAAYGDLAFRWP